MDMPPTPAMSGVRRPIGCLLAATLLVAGCGTGDDRSGGGGDSGSRLTVEASFYPLQWMAEQVGGTHVSVSNLTKPGTEPHDLELTPKAVAQLADADLVVYLSGFQPAVDDAMKNAGGTAFDAKASATLDRTFGKDTTGEDEPGSTDPHFWLDPTKLAAVASAFADTLADRDPTHAKDYRANAAGLVAELTDLDGEYEAALSDCSATDLVTSHEAFGYLADRYGLEQVGIAGLTPEQEPSATDLANVTKFVKQRNVRTIYFETLVSPAVAKTVAVEAGARTAVLDPIEGLTDRSDGSDYLKVMRSNLKNLQAGQPCP